MSNNFIEIILYILMVGTKNKEDKEKKTLKYEYYCF